MSEIQSWTRVRLDVARDELNAMKTSTTSAEFSTALLAFLTFGRSVLDVAQSEAVQYGIRQPTKHRVEAAQEEELVKYFVGARNAALKQGQYARMRTTVSIEPMARIRINMTTGDVLVRPSGIDESQDTASGETIEIAVRGEALAEALAPPVVHQEFYFTTGPYSGQSVISLSEQFLARLETIVTQLEASIATAVSSGSAE